MDIRDQVMGNKPTDFLHKIAGIVPGFNGYMDRERRRDADKLLRVYLAHQYSDGRARLTRVEQTMVRGGNLQHIAEVDRIAGILQRFIDRLTTATYGYAGLFDPIKIEGPQLDMLYAFDMALTQGVDQVSTAVGGLESAASSTATDANAVPSALDKLATLVDDLNNRLNQRQDFLSTGQGLPQDQYNSMLTQLNQGSGATPAAPATPATPATPAVPPVAPTQPEVPSGANAPYVAPSQTTMSGTPSTGAPTMPMSSTPTQPGSSDAGNMARVQGAGAGDTSSSYSDESKPETPRTTPPDTMGVAGVYIPPVEQWQGVPQTDTSSTSATSGTSETSTSGASAATPPASTAGPAPASTSNSWSGDASFGSSGDTQSMDSSTGSDYGSSQDSSGGSTGDYGNSGSLSDSGSDNDSGIQSASSPSMLGGDVADGSPLTGSSDSVTDSDSSGGTDSDLGTQSGDSDLNPRSNM